MCRNAECSRCTFIRDYRYRGYLPEVKQQITEMALNGSGIRDTARVLKISPTTVIETLKKSPQLKTVNGVPVAFGLKPSLRNLNQLIHKFGLSTFLPILRNWLKFGLLHPTTIS